MARLFDAPAIVFGAGDGQITFNHTDDRYVFGADLAGYGVVQQLAGITILTGDSGLFEGTTDILGGTLRVDEGLERHVV